MSEQGRSGPVRLRQLSRAAAVTALASAIGGMAVLAAETIAARTRRYAKPDMQLAIRSTIGPAKAPPLRLVLLGDSTALGVGVDRVSDTVGGQLAALLAEGPGGRRVELSSVAVAGSHSSDLGIQVARALVGPRPDLAVILIGANDATRLARPGEAADQLAAAVRRLRGAGAAVVVGTCPDLSSARAFAPPLRQLLGWHGRRLARAQADAVREAGGVPVDLAERVGPVFRADAGTLCHDGFHPSADGYRVWAHALLPAVVAAVGGYHHQ
jgi:lysophospholipase L1-like esterase